MLSKIKIELVVDDKSVEKVLGIICEVEKKGNMGNGKIFILPVEEIIRLMTCER